MIFITDSDYGEICNKVDLIPDKYISPSINQQKHTVIACGDYKYIFNRDCFDPTCRVHPGNTEFTTAFIGGSCENYERLLSDEFETVDFHGGKAKKILDSVYYLMRGNIFDFEGKKFFVFGGGRGHDGDRVIVTDPALLKEYDRCILKDSADKRAYFNSRIENYTWWKEEMPTQEEMDYGLKNLSEHGNKVDYIISYCGPQSVCEKLYDNFRSYPEDSKMFQIPLEPTDKLKEYFDLVSVKADFSRWFFPQIPGTTPSGLYNSIEKDICSNRQIKYPHPYEDIMPVLRKYKPVGFGGHFLRIE